MSYGPPPGPPPGGYGPPSGGYGAPPPPGPGMGGPAGPQPDNWMWAAIVSLFCCTLFGIISLIFSLQVSSKWQMGDYAGAQDSANKAKIFGLIGIIGGVVGGIAWVLWYILVVAASTSTYYY
ncbi:CD225/dispanin family protein [Spiractinospora alimapuensis]|nr:CD225/dispanin family protein [Spiractinospora alimapuensis]QVQ53093.1 CD225/dispanin family protein [Spiractinospora alimapuensis]